MRLGLVLISALALTGCDRQGDDLAFDGQFFRARLDTQNKARDEFIVSATPVSASLLGAREAARFEATVHCVNRFGRSDIIWTVGPDSPDEQLTISNDTLTLQGRCRQ